MRAALLALILLAGCGDPWTVQTVSYQEGSYATVYRPHGDALRPVVVAIHGGAWQGGSRNNMAPLCQELARSGIVAVAPDYRLVPSAPWPAQLEDVRACVGWIASAATIFRFDVGRMGITGVSAGGHLASMAALTTGPRVLCTMDAESDLTALVAYPDQHGYIVTLFGNREPTAEELRQASPVTYARPCAALIVHSIGDPLMPVDQGDRLNVELLRAGADVTYWRRNDSTHDQVRDDRVVRGVAQWFEEHLR